MSPERSRLVGALWWLLIAAPPVSLAIQVSTGYMAHSPDEASGLGPDALLVLLAVLLAFVGLVRTVVRWRRSGRAARIEALGAAFAVIPLVVVVGAIAELVGWPRTRTASPLHFAAAVLVVLAWTVAVLLARRRLRVHVGRDIVAPRFPQDISKS